MADLDNVRRRFLAVIPTAEEEDALDTERAGLLGVLARRRLAQIKAIEYSGDLANGRAHLSGSRWGDGARSNVPRWIPPPQPPQGTCEECGHPGSAHTLKGTDRPTPNWLECHCRCRNFSPAPLPQVRSGELPSVRTSLRGDGSFQYVEEGIQTRDGVKLQLNLSIGPAFLVACLKNPDQAIVDLAAGVRRDPSRHLQHRHAHLPPRGCPHVFTARSEDGE